MVDTTRHFRPNDKTTMTVKHSGISNDEIGGGYSTLSALFVSARLDRDRIIAGIKGAAFDDAIGAGLQVEGIIVLTIPGIFNMHISQDDMFAQMRMQGPGRRI